MNNTSDKKASILKSEAAPGMLLLIATIIALIFANTPLRSIYDYVIYRIGFGEEFNIHFLINDFLMAIFFFVVGCEIKREIVFGELSNIRKAAFPILAAIGGMAVPALIFTLFNYNTQFEIGVGIPLSTDIAFAIGIFSLLKDKVNPCLKIFLLTLAVVDDLLSILIIGIFYTSRIRMLGIIVAILLTIILLTIRKINRLYNLFTYVVIGLLLWIAIFYSGVHSTLSGVILAFCMPVYDKKNRDKDLSYKLHHKLEGFSNFVILPLFAFSNTGINLSENLDLKDNFTEMLGIILGLVVGKPLGIMSFGYLGSLLKIANKPDKASWYELFIVAVIAGIGFTMSLFVSEIAFSGHNIEISVAKISILIAALISIILSYILSILNKKSKK